MNERDIKILRNTMLSHDYHIFRINSKKKFSPCNFDKNAMIDSNRYYLINCGAIKLLSGKIKLSLPFVTISRNEKDRDTKKIKYQDKVHYFLENILVIT